MLLATKLRVWLLASSLAAGWIVPSCQVAFQAWLLIKIWMITWRNSFARKPPNLLVSKPPNFNFGWLPTKFLILFGGQPQFLILVGGQPKFSILVGGQHFFFKSVGEQPFFEILVGGPPKFWNWSVSNHFWDFGRWPTIIFENGWWATIFQNLVGGQPNFLENGWWPTSLFSFFFAQNRSCAHLILPKSRLCTLIFSYFWTCAHLF